MWVGGCRCGGLGMGGRAGVLLPAMPGNDCAALGRARAGCGCGCLWCW